MRDTTSNTEARAFKACLSRSLRDKIKTSAGFPWKFSPNSPTGHLVISQTTTARSLGGSFTRPPHVSNRPSHAASRQWLGPAVFRLSKTARAFAPSLFVPATLSSWPAPLWSSVDTSDPPSDPSSPLILPRPSLPPLQVRQRCGTDVETYETIKQSALPTHSLRFHL